jgi:hypothetical protein
VQIVLAIALAVAADPHAARGAATVGARPVVAQQAAVHGRTLWRLRRATGAIGPRHEVRLNPLPSQPRRPFHRHKLPGRG